MSNRDPRRKDLITDLSTAPLPLRKPSWLRMKRQGGSDYNDVKRMLRTSSLNTVCESANCPNRGECFSSRTATFMLLGEVCTLRPAIYCRTTLRRMRRSGCR